jgi:hypothetical protein
VIMSGLLLTLMKRQELVPYGGKWWDIQVQVGGSGLYQSCVINFLEYSSYALLVATDPFDNSNRKLVTWSLEIETS